MNLLRRILLLLFTPVLAVSLVAAESVSISFVSLSLQIAPGRAEDPLHGLEWTSSLSSSGNPNSINHELMLSAGGHAFSHEGTFLLQDPFAVEPYVIPFVLDVPPEQDANDNGVDDFFDIDMPVDGIETLGRHPDGQGGGVDFSATWFRPGGDAVGSVVIYFPFFDLRFEHFFQLQHYRGEFVYERDAANRHGTLSLTNSVDPADTITGPLSIEVATTNNLDYAATNWTSGAGLDYVTLSNFDVGRSGTNFVSFWTLEDGYFGSVEPDYLDWAMVVHGTDADGNGQIDLVESSDTPTEGPRLEVVRLPAGGLELTIIGTVGQTYLLESTETLPAAIWQTEMAINLSAPAQKLPLAETGNRRILRLRVP